MTSKPQIFVRIFHSEIFVTFFIQFLIILIDSPLNNSNEDINKIKEFRNHKY